jgi:hypothetical protein
LRTEIPARFYEFGKKIERAFGLSCYLSTRKPLFKDSMDDKEEFEGVEKAAERVTILALILGVLHVRGQLFLAQR